MSPKNPNQQEPITPWYKEPWMLLVMGVPIVAIMWGGIILTLALTGKDSLVSDSYYKDGMTYTENKILTSHAKKLNLTADMQYNNGTIEVSVEGFLPELPSFLRLQMIHPTLETEDEIVTLQRQQGNRFLGLAEKEHLGKRKLWLESPEQKWMIKDEKLIENQKPLQLTP